MRSAFLLIALLFALLVPEAAHAAGAHDLKSPEFVERMKDFNSQEAAAGIQGIGPRLSFRAKEQPFLVVATVIFILAITVTLNVLSLPCWLLALFIIPSPRWRSRWTHPPPSSSNHRPIPYKKHIRVPKHPALFGDFQEDQGVDEGLGASVGDHAEFTQVGGDDVGDGG